MKIAIINGPNLNLIGSRETDIYGGESFEHYFNKIRKKYENVDFDYYQSNVEGELINELQSAGQKMDGIILNAGGYTHTSIALCDTVAALTIPVVEVHISSIEARKDLRNVSYLKAKLAGTILGCVL